MNLLLCATMEHVILVVVHPVLPEHAKLVIAHPVALELVTLATEEPARTELVVTGRKPIIIRKVRER